MFAISTPSINQEAILRRCANTSTIAAQSRAAALGLALIVLEDEQIIGADLNSRAVQGHIGHARTETLGLRRKTRGHVAAIIGAHGDRLEAVAEIVHECLG